MICRVCQSALSRRATSGLCRNHFFQTLLAERPELEAKRVEGIRRDSSNRRDEKRALFIKNAAEARKRPEVRAKLIQNARIMQKRACTPEVIARIDLKARGAKCTATRLSWCPPAYRGQYRELVKRKLIKASDARVMILDQIKRDTGGITDPLALAILTAGLAA